MKFMSNQEFMKIILMINKSKLTNRDIRINYI